MAAIPKEEALAALRDFVLTKPSGGANLKSYNASLSKQLHSMAADHGVAPMCGASPLERAEVRQWIEFSVEASSSCGKTSKGAVRETVQGLDGHLLHRSFMAGGNEFTLADVVVYFTLYRHLLSFEVQERSNWRNVARWFNMVQSYPGLKPDSWEFIVFLSNHNLLKQN